MSRHDLVPLDPAHEVVVGWDPPLRTFFAQILDAAGEDDGACDALWIGTGFGEVYDPTAVLAAVAPFASMPAGLIAMLEQDRLKDE